MEVYQFEPRGRQAPETLYAYDETKDLLQLSNNIVYKLNSDRVMNSEDFTRFMNEFDALSKGETQSVVLDKIDVFLGKLGLPDEIPSKHKENLWVL